MEKTGFYYYFNNSALTTSVLNYYWDFRESGVYSNNSGLQGFYISGNESNFWSEPFIASISNTVLAPSGDTIDQSNYTLMLDFESAITGAQVLFSTFNNSSGLIFGISDSNKLFCSSFDTLRNNFITKIFNINLLNKNSIFL
jgi:hypothetical protein